MCTVSFVFSNGKAILTHNRDEKVARPSAIEPQKYTVNNKNIYFPKDQKAGGTWYAAVSYTHLDVYKRQPVTLLKTLISFRNFKTPKSPKIKASLNSNVLLSGIMISIFGK